MKYSFYNQLISQGELAVHSGFTFEQERVARKIVTARGGTERHIQFFAATNEKRNRLWRSFFLGFGGYVFEHLGSDLVSVQEINTHPVNKLNPNP